MDKYTISTDYSVYIYTKYSVLSESTYFLGLSPATEYQFYITATNGAGSLTSNASVNSTLFDVPEGISPPSISIATAVSLNVVWQMPTSPNGDIINYKLLIDQVEVFQGLQLQTTVTGRYLIIIFNFVLI